MESEMAIVFKLDAQGGFTCGDTETKLTAYAYPTSQWADRSRKHPEPVAVEMLSDEAWRKPADNMWRRDYDKRNWQRLEVSP